jgi:uncharacterized protein with FMN-binding domain
VVTGMRRIVLWAASTVVIVALLFGYRTSLEGPAKSDVVVSYSAATSTKSSTSDSSSGTASGTSSSGATTSTRTVTGDAVWTRYGPVQVRISASGSQITDVTVLQYPNSNGRDAEINSQALPILVDETMQAQSAQVDMVSGATYTSQGYLQSLQAALDGAGL